MGKKRKGRCVKRNKNIQEEPEELVRAPHSFVIHKGIPGGHILELTKDFRKVMEPFTASSLKERKKNTIKDFVSVAGPLHVTHLVAFTRTELGMYLKVCRLPRGPTLTFKINNFSLSKDVISSLKKQLVIENAFKHSPLLILNGFGGEGVQMKLMSTMFQNMFPKINLTKVDLNDIRRCLLLNYDQNTKLIDFRHYTIKVAPVGVSKGVKKIVTGKIPNLAKCEDIADFLTKSGAASESEFEDDPSSHVTLSQKMVSRGAMQMAKSAVRLSELGPRITLQLIKIEDGLLEGEVLYHDYIQKTEEEKFEIQKKRDAKRKLKERRKRMQDENKRRKEAEKEELKQKALKGIERSKAEANKIMKKSIQEGDLEAVPEVDDDAEYYRQEVGEEPDKDLFLGKASSNKLPKAFKRNKTKSPKESNKFHTSNDRSKRSKKQVDKTNSSNRDHRPIGGASRKNKLPGVKSGKIAKKYRKK